MPDTPPRRQRRPPPSNSGSSFPLIPIVLGVIVIGFVIGAGLSMVGKHGAEPVAVATSAPTIEPTLAPATLAPTEKPTREPTNEPATRAPATQIPATNAPATRAPATRAPATDAAVAAATAATAAPAAPAAPAATVSAAAAAKSATPAPVTRAPASHATAMQGTATAHATDAPPATDDADSEFGRLAAGLVRGYLAAVARGDSASAATSLASSSDRVTEASVVDGTTHIKHVEARSAGDAATVNVDFETASGAYFGQYTVRRTSSGAAVIVSHSIIKP